MTCRHVKWAPCHHDMAHPYVAGRGDGLHIWKVAVNILNKQSRTADRGWPSSLGLGGVLTTPTAKHICCEVCARASEMELGWGSVGWIQLAQDRDRCWALVNTVMNLRVLAPRS
jgi:hypothetical protein